MRQPEPEKVRLEIWLIFSQLKARRLIVLVNSSEYACALLSSLMVGIALGVSFSALVIRGER